MNHIQIPRTFAAGNVPAIGVREEGELWLNFPDLQLGFIDATQAPQKLMGVRLFIPTANYAARDFVIYGGQLYFAKANISAGMWDPVLWTRMASMEDVGGAIISDVPPPNPDIGNLWFDSVSLTLFLWYDDSITAQWVSTAGGGGGGGGITEAPIDGKLYGRQDANWEEVLSGGGGGGTPTDVTGIGTTFVLQNQPTVNQPHLMGVINGSYAAPGEIGEILRTPTATTAFNSSAFSGNTVLTSLLILPGDWQVYGAANIWLTGISGTGSDTIAAGQYTYDFRLSRPAGTTIPGFLMVHEARQAIQVSNMSGRADNVSRANMQTGMLTFSNSAPVTINLTMLVQRYGVVDPAVYGWSCEGSVGSGGYGICARRMR